MRHIDHADGYGGSNVWAVGCTGHLTDKSTIGEQGPDVFASRWIALDCKRPDGPVDRSRRQSMLADVVFCRVHEPAEPSLIGLSLIHI